MSSQRFSAPFGIAGSFTPTATTSPGARRSTLAASRSPRVTRKDFTDRLGIPEDASNAQVLAAVDAVTAKAPQSVSAADELYAAAGWSESATKPPQSSRRPSPTPAPKAVAREARPLPADALYEMAWGNAADTTGLDTFAPGRTEANR